MALGGGVWLTQNKILPGTYINFVSLDKPKADMVDRGYGTIALELDWGPVDEIFRVDGETFEKQSQAVLGYDYGHSKMKTLRDLFKKLKTAYFYRLNSDGEKAYNELAKAKYPGVRGNDITMAVQNDPDNSGKFIVYTYLTTDGVRKTVDKQTNISTMADLDNNEYVDFISTGTLEVAASKPLSGGTNGSTVTVADYQKYIEYIEPYYFNTIGYAGNEEDIQNLLISFTHRCRESTNSKFQCVLYGAKKVNYEGVISINEANEVKDKGYEKGSLVYWVMGAEASCPVNASCTNMIYDGEFTVNTNLKQFELEQAILDGLLTIHKVTDPAGGNIEGDARVLKDLNTFVDFSKQKNDDFRENQIIRVLDNLAIDFSRLFNKTHLGKSANDPAGQTSLWSDGVTLLEKYQTIRAIQNFSEKDLELPKQGEAKDSVVWNLQVQPTVCMTKLYIATVVA